MIKKCASPLVTFWVLIYMMLLLVFGTLAQKYIGLYGALDKYFYSWVIWAGFIPLPGGLLVMGAFFVNLLSRFIGYSRWTREKAGIHLAHAGVILLLIGGIISAVSRIDTVVPLQINELKRETQSYDQSALSLYKNGLRLVQFPLAEITDGQMIQSDIVPFKVKVINRCVNCEIAIDKNDGGMTLLDKPQEIDREQNLSGATFKIVDDADEMSERKIAFLYFPKPPVITVGADEFTIMVERVYSPLPFEIKLNDFTIEYHPGTSQAKSYQSNIDILDNGEIIPAAISMNEPVSHKGYSLYQSAYQVDQNGQYTSIIAVVYNQGRIFPYIAGLITALGLLLHIFFKLKGRINQASIRFSAIILYLFASLYPASAQANIEIQSGFMTLPVLHDGRIKPMDSFARVHLKMFSDQESPMGEAPSQTLARIIFNPYDAVELEIFKIKNKRILSEFGLAERSEKLYSYKQLAVGLDASRKDFTDIIKKQQNGLSLNEYETALFNIHSRALYFLQLVRSFSFAMPLEGSSEETILDYRSLQKNTILLRDALNAIRAEKGNNIETYTAAETETAYLNYQLDTLEKTGRNNLLLRVIPSSDPREKWTTPWQILTGGKGTPVSQKYIEQWVWMMIAFQGGNEKLWQRSVSNLEKFYAEEITDNKLEYEYIYNIFRPVMLALILSLLVSASLIISHLQKSKTIKKISLFFAVGASAILGTAVAFRVMLLERPPVGTLYESILFVCFILTAGVLFLYSRRKQTAPVFAAFIMAAFLLLLAKTIDTAQDNLQMMEAVLNTNFWLATHVLIITAGYAWCILTSSLAHIELFQNKRAVKKSALHSHALISLFLITLGTVLGGIWADMSWGRFWGWDPKENGALLIALWLIWCLHSRASGHLSDLLFKISLAGLSMIVMLSWFGVNLLNVGLHTYGFINGLAYALFGFIFVEIIILSSLYYRAKKQ